MNVDAKLRDATKQRKKKRSFVTQKVEKRSFVTQNCVFFIFFSEKKNLEGGRERRCEAI